MLWLKVIGLVLQLALWLLSWAERRKAIAEGEANAIKIMLEKSDELLDVAQRARDSVSDEPASGVLDEFDRDNDQEDRREPPKDGV